MRSREPILPFVRDVCEKDPTAEVSENLLVVLYGSWCSMRGRPPMAMEKFLSTLERPPFGAVRVDGMVRGYRLKHTGEEEPFAQVERSVIEEEDKAPNEWEKLDPFPGAPIKGECIFAFLQLCCDLVEGASIPASRLWETYTLFAMSNRRKATYAWFFLDVIQGEKFGLRKVDDVIHGVKLKPAFQAWLDEMFGS